VAKSLALTFRTNGTGTATLSNNLIGESSNTSSTAFVGVTPDATNIIAASDGNAPTPLSGILSPLADNGGETLTQALIDGSPAINAGSITLCPDTDQRDEPRNDGACDVGAFEVQNQANGPTQADGTFFVVPLPNGSSVIFGL